MSATPVTDLAPQRVPRLLSSLFSGGQAKKAEPRERHILWEDYMKDTSLTVLEVCGNKIILGLDNGQINIYNSMDLSCQTSLPYYNERRVVLCLQCTCTEIIAGYSDGNICVWNIKSGNLVQKLSLRHPATAPHRNSTCMRWKGSKLVLGANDGKVLIFQYVNANVKALGEWTAGSCVRMVDFDTNYVMAQDNSTAYEIRVYNWNGKRLHSIALKGSVWGHFSISDVTSFSGKVITGSRENVVKILDLKTGGCVHELKGHHNAGLIHAVDALNDCAVSCDVDGATTLWSLTKDASPGRSPQSVHVMNVVLPARFQETCPYNRIFWLRLGRNFLASHVQSSAKVVITDFP